MGENNSEKPAATHIDRRQFLKWVGTGTTAAVASSIAGSVPQVETKEKIKQIPEPIQIDFAPEKPTPGIKQTEFPNNEQLARSFLGDKYRSIDELEHDFMMADRTAEEEFEGWAVKNYPEAALFQAYLARFKDHGTEVAQAMKKGGNLIGKTIEPTMIPLQNLIRPENVTFMSDEWENAGIAVNLEPQPIIDAIRKVRLNTLNQKVVNLSILMGKTEIWQSPLTDPYPNKLFVASTTNEKGIRIYTVGNKPFETQEAAWDGWRLLMVDYNQTEEGRNLGSRRIEPYTKEKIGENFPKLIEIAKAFPDMVICAATGNASDDLRSVKDQIPPNLIMLADWDPKENKPVFDIPGAEIYVPYQEVAEGFGSSMATGFMSAVATALVEQGVEVNDIKPTILKMCQPKNWKLSDETSEAAQILDLTKLRAVRGN